MNTWPHLLFALLLSGGVGWSQSSEKHLLPTLILEADGRLVPPTSRVLAIISKSDYSDKVETQVGEKGRVSLGVKWHHRILRSFHIALFVDPAVPRQDSGKPTYLYASKNLDGREPSHRVSLRPRAASFLGSGRLLDSTGQPFADVRLDTHITTNIENPEEQPSEDGGSITFLGSSQHAYLVGSITTDAQGKFSLWSAISADPGDHINLRCDKPNVLGIAWFRFKPGKKGLALQVPATGPLGLSVKLPVGLPRYAYGIHLSTFFDGYDRDISLVTIRQEEVRKHGDVWTIRCPPVPPGKYKLALKPLNDHNVLTPPRTIMLPRKENQAAQESIDWSRKDRIRNLQAKDPKGVGIPGTWVGLYDATWPLPTSGSWYKLRYAVPADAQGRIALDPLHHEFRAAFWSPRHRMKVIEPDQAEGPIALEEIPRIEWRVPDEFAKPRKNLRIHLRLVPVYGSKSPQPPWQVLDWWKRPVDKTGVVHMRIGYSGAMVAWLVLENTKTGAIGRIKAYSFRLWRNLDKTRDPVSLRFSKRIFTSLLESLQIR